MKNSANFHTLTANLKGKGVIYLDIYKTSLVVRVKNSNDGVNRTEEYTNIYKAFLDYHRIQNSLNGKIISKASIELIEYYRGKL